VAGIRGDGGDYVDVTLVCDIMMSFDSSIRPALYLAEELVSRGHTVSMMSPVMSDEVEQRLRSIAITPLNLHVTLLTKRLGLSMSWLEAWAWEAVIHLNSMHARPGASTVLNFSQMVAVPAFAWYLQGPPSLALRDIRKELPPDFRLAYALVKPALEYFDERLIRRMKDASTRIIANSQFCAALYAGFEVTAQAIIYPPLDCHTFRPSTAKPSADYVLTYVGKEIKISVIKRIADRGVKIKAFGSKTPFIRKDLMGHPNIEFLGRVTTQKLLDAYSNALFILFPFTHEPFGYVPLEGLACGTPVLTENRQGPREYITDAVTGWLMPSDEALIRKAIEVWTEGYPAQMRGHCIEAAAKFDVGGYLEKWRRILSASF
jgi:glycosyltransferase involved in cell wall biosynthesis